MNVRFEKNEEGQLEIYTTKYKKAPRDGYCAKKGKYGKPRAFLRYSNLTASELRAIADKLDELK